MPWRLLAYSESVDAADAVNAITPVVDTPNPTDVDFYRVQADRNQIIGYGALISSGGTQLARINAASILNKIAGGLNISPRVNALVWGSPPEVLMFPRSPIALKPDEGVSIEQRSDPSGAERQYGLLWMSSGPIEPVTGQIVTIRFTGAIALSAGAWVAGAITLAQSLPSGNYDVVGLRVESTNGVAARLIPVRGGDDRPGVPVVNAAADYDSPLFRYGGLGVWFNFHNTQTPSLDALGVTDTTQVGYLDIVQRG